MRLTERALLGLRVLALLETADRALTVGEIAGLTRSPRDHVSKVVHALASESLIATIRGRHGGVRARTGPPARPSSIVATLETCLPRRDCSPCPLAPDCALPALLGPATEAFLEALDARGLAPFRDAPATVIKACR